MLILAFVFDSRAWSLKPYTVDSGKGSVTLLYWLCFCIGIMELPF